jgi:hypothetical protein
MKNSFKFFLAFHSIFLFSGILYSNTSFADAKHTILFGKLGNTGATEYSSPEISLVHSIVTHGKTVDISGFGFGTKTNAAPQIWDDFEKGSDKANVGGGWSSYRSRSSPVYTATEKHSGQLSVMNSVFSGSGTSFNTAWQTFERSDETYASYWFRYSLSGNPYGIMKLARVTSADDNGLKGHYNGPGDFNVQYQTASGWKYAGYNFGSDTNQKTIGGSTPMDTWIRIEMYKKLSTPGMNDGAILVKINNQVVWSENELMTREKSASFQHYSFLMPLMFANSQSGAVIDLYVDDIYVDNTLARIEVANCPDFNTCSKSEIQIPQSWTPFNLSFKANIESFSAEETLYLFIINAKGVVSKGKRIN